MKCPYCNKFIFSKQKSCGYCGSWLDDSCAEERIEVIKRWEELNAKFEFTEENVRKIAALNDLLSKKYNEMVEGVEKTLRPILLEFQNNGFEDYYEYKIRGTVAIVTETETHYADAKMHDKINEAVYYHKCPEPDYKIDYNDFYLNKTTAFCKEYLEPVPHRGVFKNPAFDGMEICKTMDIIFNVQKGYTLVDALYFEEKDIQIDYEIDTAKKLWKKDRNLWNKKFIICPECHHLSRPDSQYCTKHHYPRMAKTWINNKAEKHHLKNAAWSNFDWNYENKMKVYALNDRITELFDHMYDESFRLQKVFNKLKEDGNAQFNFFEITGFLKYLNREPTPLMNRKTARILNDAMNTNYAIHASAVIRPHSKWNEADREYNNYLSSKDDFMNWNIEGFDRSFVGNHLINFYMHSLFMDSWLYSMNDILYMNPDDFVPQFEITMSNHDWSNGEE